MDPPSARRERFGHRKEGTGRIASAHRFNIGPRTGLQLDSNLKKDADGFDDVDDLFGAPKHARAGGTVAGGLAESKRLYFPAPTQSALTASAAVATVVPSAQPLQSLARDDDFGAAGLADDGYDGGHNNVDDGDGVGAALDNRLSVPGKVVTQRSEASSGRLGAQKRKLDKSTIAKMIAARKAAADERKRARESAARAARSNSRGDDSDDASERGGGYSPGDVGSGRVRPSLHTGAADAEGNGRAKRRRWQPLDHWRGERVLYTEAGAVQAEKLGVSTPAAEALGKKRKRIADDDDDHRQKQPRGGGRGRHDSRSRSAERSRGRSADRSRGGGLKTAPKKGSSTGRRAASPTSDDGDSTDGRDASRSRSASRHHQGKKSGSKHDGSDRRAGRDDVRAALQRHDDEGRGLKVPKKHGGERDSADSAAAAAAVRELRKEAEEAARGTRLQEPLSPRRLPKGFREALSPTLTVPATGGHPMYQIAVVRHSAHLAYEKLPVTGTRPKGLEHPALAGAAFDAPQFISGTVRLRPGARKDNESTHTSTQVFVVVGCQPRALEVDIADQAYLLSPGDHFFVPQQTTYTLSNHSVDADAEVAFTVIKPSA